MAGVVGKPTVLQVELTLKSTASAPSLTTSLRTWGLGGSVRIPRVGTTKPLGVGHIHRDIRRSFTALGLEVLSRDHL